MTVSCQQASLKANSIVTTTMIMRLVGARSIGLSATKIKEFSLVKSFVTVSMKVKTVKRTT